MQTQSNQLKVSWEDYHQSIEQLAIKIHASGWKCDQILCLARGGLRIGDVLSRLFQVPLAIISVSSYRDEGGTKQAEIHVASTISATIPHLFGRVLVVDDLVDTGGSVKEVLKTLPLMFSEIVEMKTAVIWCKQASTFTPDFYVEFLKTNPWIIQPFEVYDQISMSDLIEKINTK